MIFKIVVLIALLLLLDAQGLQIPWVGNNVTWIFFVFFISISLILDMIVSEFKRRQMKFIVLKLAEIERLIKTIPRCES